MTKDKRVEYLDVAKFIGLVLVCFCHIPYPEGNFHVWVYSYHMPLFFIISGVFFSPEKFAVGKSIKQLLVPFVFYNLLALMISWIVGVISKSDLSFPHYDFSRLLQSSYIIGPSWFLVSLLLIRLYCGLILKYTSPKVLIVLSSLVTVLFFSTTNFSVWNVLSLGSTVLGLPFYLFGFYLKRYFTDSGKVSKPWLLITALFISILAIYNGLVGIHANSYGSNSLLFLIFGIAGSVLIISLSIYIRLPRAVLTVFTEGALFFICMHTLIFEYLILLWNKLTNDFSGNTIIEKIVVTVLTFIVCYPIIVLMLKHSPTLLGRSKKNGIKRENL